MIVSSPRLRGKTQYKPSHQTIVTKISALIHSHDDERRLGRALETLRPCDEIVVIDHGCSDRTRAIAREYGAIVRAGILGVNPGAYAADLKHDWVLCLLPTESLSESLEASLLEWKEDYSRDGNTGQGYSVAIREETESGWITHPAELRLVNRTCINWTGVLPPNECLSRATELTLAGEILRFSKP